MALSRLTRGAVGGSFTLNPQFAFGRGCDWPSYVARHHARLTDMRASRFRAGMVLATALKAGLLAKARGSEIRHDCCRLRSSRAAS